MSTSPAQQRGSEDAAAWHPAGPRVAAGILDRVVAAALDEDLAGGDVTSETLVPRDLRASVRMVAREQGVVAGLPVAAAVFRAVDPSVEVVFEAADGQRVEAGAPLLRVRGATRALLMAERVALNFVQRMSGTASLTARFVDAVAGTGARIVDTRKTTPGLRALEKYAVRCGGGANHRRDLGDAVMVKDNHRAALAAGGVDLALVLAEARRRLPHTVTVEIEVDALDELDAVMAARPDTVLLDNMGPDALREAVTRIGGRARAEASGGITLDTVRAVAETGVDLISVGALTHSAPALDVALDWDQTGE